MTTSSTRAGSRSLRSTSALSGAAARSTACQPDSLPLRRPTGVRTASTITALGMRDLLARSGPFGPTPLHAPGRSIVAQDLAVCQIRRHGPPVHPRAGAVPGRGPVVARGQRPVGGRAGTGPLPSLDTAGGFEAHRAWERTMFDARWSVVSWPEEYGGRGVGLLEWLDLRGGVLPGRGAHPGGAERHLPPGPHAVRVRDGRAEGALPPRHGVGGGDLVPGMVRARRRQRPRRHPQPGHPCGPRRAAWVLNGQKTWCSRGRLRRLDLRAVPLRSRGRAPPGPHLLPRAHGQSRA